MVETATIYRIETKHVVQLPRVIQYLRDQTGSFHNQHPNTKDLKHMLHPQVYYLFLVVCLKGNNYYFYVIYASIKLY